MKVTSTDTQVYATQDALTIQTDEVNTVESNTTVSEPDTVDLSQEAVELSSTDFIADIDSETKMKNLNNKTNEFESLVNSLDLNNVDVEALNSVLATVESEVNQANEDYQNGDIDEKELSSILHATLDNGIDGINSLTSEVGNQTTIAVTQSSVKSTDTTTEDPVATTSEPVTETDETLATTTSDEETVNIAEMFDTINKIIKVIESASETNNVVKEMEELMEKVNSLKVEELKEKISDLEKIDYSKFAEKLRKLQTSMIERNKMFGEEKKDGGNIGSIGMGTKETDAFQPGGLTADRFISSISSSINEALKNYKEVKEATEEKDAKEATEVNEEKQVNAEAELRALA